MKYRLEFSQEKNLLLKETRGVSFEDVIEKVRKGKILDYSKIAKTTGLPVDEAVPIAARSAYKTEERTTALAVGIYLQNRNHPNQRILVIKIKNYIYAVPYVVNQKEKTIFLKTIYPSRVLNKKYLKKGTT